jgi:tetratricopeptide (TPR) repeat protein
VKTSTLRILSAFVLATAMYALAIPQLSKVQQLRRLEQISLPGEIPAGVVRAFSFEFKGVVADYLMLQAMTFVGERLIENRDLSKEEWQHLHRLLTKITDIDQRFWDPYLLTETMLVWQAGMIEESNQLLLKAAEHRPWDYRPYYFLGFNHFYFQKNAEKAAPYLRKAAQIPGAPYYLQGLAARFSLYGNETATAVLFLDDMLRETTDPAIRLYLEKRLLALKIIHDLEKKVQAFKAATGSLPRTFAEIIDSGLLKEIPADPYGGEFVLLGNGRIYTTSQLVSLPNGSSSP